MTILPERPREEDGPPPLVAYWRDVIRTSRVGRWIAAHKNVAAAVAGLFAVLKVWKWALWDLVWVIRHPGATVHWVGGHLVLALILTVAVFGITFAVSRLGLEWFSGGDDDGPPPDRPRPSNRHTDMHVPRGA